MKIRSSLTLAPIVFLLSVFHCAADPPTFDRFFPTAVSVGTSASIAAEGKFPTWPVEIFCDRSDVSIQCESKSGKLSIDIPAEAPPGVAWVRLFDAGGATELRPLLIESSPVLVESEPNNQLSEAAEVALPTTIAGRLEKSEDVDGFRISLDKGETLVARVVGKRVLNSAMDAVLQLTDLSGNVLSQSDDEVGVDPQLVYAAQEPQQLVVRVFAFPETPNSTIGFAGAAGYTYALKLFRTPVADHFLPLIAAEGLGPLVSFGWNLESTQSNTSPATSISPQVAFATATTQWQWVPLVEGSWTSKIEAHGAEESSGPFVATKLPAIFSGHIAEEGEVDAFRFRVAAGKKIRAHVHSRDYGFPLDSVLRIIDPGDGSEISRNDDSQRNEYDASLEFTPKADTELELQVSDLADSASPRHTYSVQIAEVKPDIELSVAADHFAVKAGESIELPISVARKDGFDRSLSLALKELPVGVTCEPVISEPKGDSSKSVKLKISADKTAIAAQVQFEIVAIDASSKADNAEVDVASRPAWHAAYQLRPQVSIRQFWLTVIASQ